jgi:hypothetical protein
MKEPQSRNRAKLNICIDTRLKEVIIDFANNDGRSISWLVDAALRDWLEKRGREVPPRGVGRLRLARSVSR